MKVIIRLKFKLANKIISLLGYKSLLSQEDGFLFFVGKKYEDKGWHTITLQFKSQKEDEYFKGSIDNVALFSRKLSDKELKEFYKFDQ